MALRISTCPISGRQLSWSLGRIAWFLGHKHLFTSQDDVVIACASYCSSVFVGLRLANQLNLATTNLAPMCCGFGCHLKSPYTKNRSGPKNNETLTVK